MAAMLLCSCFVFLHSLGIADALVLIETGREHIISLSAARSKFFAGALKRSSGKTSVLLRPRAALIDEPVDGAGNGSLGSFGAGIPKVIHQTWRSLESLEQLTRQDLNKWESSNPGFRYVFWNDADAEVFMQKYAPEDAEMRRNIQPIEKFDYFRYLVLDKIGGVYSDIDVGLKVPVLEWPVPAGTSLITGWEARLKDDHERSTIHFARVDQLQQWTIVGAPGHPVLEDVLARIRQNYIRRRDGNDTPPCMDDVLNFSGPGVWTDAVLAYMGTPPARRGYGCKDDAWKKRDAVVLGQEAFAVGGYPLDCYGQNLVEHHFSGTWK